MPSKARLPKAKRSREKVSGFVFEAKLMNDPAYGLVPLCCVCLGVDKPIDACLVAEIFKQKNRRKDSSVSSKRGFGVLVVVVVWKCEMKRTSR